MDLDKSIEKVLYALPFKIRQAIYKLSPTVQSNVAEIRLRKNMPVALTVLGETVFLKQNGQTCFSPCPDLLTADADDIYNCFCLLCDNSVFAHENELKDGFIIMKNGCRAGVCGSILKGSMNDVTSLNLRISREVKGCANKLLKHFTNGGLLIAGPPASGKTTLLRDVVRQLSNGSTGKINRICVIDSRGEIAGGGELDLGVATDIIKTESKGAGVEIAVRTMCPDIVAFDEIGNYDELNAVTQSFFAGVKIITTAHIDNVFDLKRRDITNRRLQSGVISQVAVLPKIIGGKIEVLTIGELYRDNAV